MGFDVERTVPCDRWLRHQQQHLDHAALRALLASTVRGLAGRDPGPGHDHRGRCQAHLRLGAGEQPKAYVGERYDPTRQPRGDPDCRLGVKRGTNQEGADGRTTGARSTSGATAPGVASATDPWYGDVVLAEWTQAFNDQDVTYFHPLYRQAVADPGQPTDQRGGRAAFDAWHVYQTCAAHEGNRRHPAQPARPGAARPRRRRSTALRLGPDDGPDATSSTTRTATASSATAVRCCFPTPTGQTCDDAELPLRARLRQAHQPRTGWPAARNPRPSRATPTRRSTGSAPRPSASTARRRPSASSGPRSATPQSVHRLNTLTYLVINARAMQRVRALNAAYPRPPAQC